MHRFGSGTEGHGTGIVKMMLTQVMKGDDGQETGSEVRHSP